MTLLYGSGDHVRDRLRVVVPLARGREGRVHHGRRVRHDDLGWDLMGTAGFVDSSILILGTTKKVRRIAPRVIASGQAGDEDANHKHRSSTIASTEPSRPLS